MKTKTNARKFTFQFYYHQVFENESVDFTVDLSKRMNDFTALEYPKSEEKFIQSILKVAFKNKSKLNALIEKYLKNWSINRISKIDRTLLDLSISEMLFLEPPTPSKVVIDEYLNLAKEFGTADSVKFINGVLDNIYHHEL